MGDDVSDETYETRFFRALKEEHERVFDSAGAMLASVAEETACPSCHSKRRTLRFVKDNFRHHTCNDCGLVYISPRLNQDATFGFYNSEANEIYNERKFQGNTTETTIDDALNLEVLEWLVGRRPPTGPEPRLLELGPARGVLMRAAQKAGFVAYGVELNTINASLLQQEFGDRVSSIDIQACQYPSEFFDVIFLRDVMEHLHNPDEITAEFARILKPGGLVCIATHNIDGLIHRIVGKRHTVIFGFEHPVHWSPTTLSACLDRHALSTSAVKYGTALDQYRYITSDISTSAILGYYLNPTFTTINRGGRAWNRVRGTLYRIINNRWIGLRNPWIAKWDARIWLKQAQRRQRENYFVLLGEKSAAN